MCVLKRREDIALHSTKESRIDWKFDSGRCVDELWYTCYFDFVSECNLGTHRYSGELL